MQKIVDTLFINGILSTDKKEALDFLFLSDSKGKVSYRCCKVLYRLIKDYDDNIQCGYTHSNNSFSYFKEMLQIVQNEKEHYIGIKDTNSIKLRS